MPNDELTKEVLLAVTPPKVPNWTSTGTAGVHAILVGASAAILQARELLEGSNQPLPRKWDSEHLASDLRSAVDEDGRLDWGKTGNLCVWSAGFFVNRAMHNLAAALERCADVWIAWELGWKLNEPVTVDTWWGSWISNRLSVLVALLRKRRAHPHVVRLVAEIGRPFYLAGSIQLGNKRYTLSNSDRAAEWITALVKHLERRKIHTIRCACDALNKDRDAFYLAFAWARTNAFKHKHALDRSDISRFRVECAVLVHALRCACTFWKTAITEAPIPARKKPPQMRRR